MFPFALLNFVFMANTIRARTTTNTYFGTTSASKTNSKRSVDKQEIERPRLTRDSPVSDFDPLELAVRMHANFLENVPLAAVFAAAIEINGGSRPTLAAILGGLVVARILHAFGLLRNNQPLRATGHIYSFTTLLILGGWASLLGWSGWS